MIEQLPTGDAGAWVQLRLRPRRALTARQFRGVFASRAKYSKEKTVRLQMDGSVKWDLHAQVVAVINNAGITDIAYVLNPTQEAGK